MSGPAARSNLRPAATPTLLGVVAMAWGVSGFTLLLLRAAVRLSAIALDSLALPWHAGHWRDCKI